MTFFRLFGSAIGDPTVSGPYTTAGTDASVVYNAEGESGSVVNGDHDAGGNGAAGSDLATTVNASATHRLNLSAPKFSDSSSEDSTWKGNHTITKSRNEESTRFVEVLCPDIGSRRFRLSPETPPEQQHFMVSPFFPQSVWSVWEN